MLLKRFLMIKVMMEQQMIYGPRGVILFVLMARYLPFDESNLISPLKENEWFKKGYRPPDFEQGEDVSLDDVVAVFNDSKMKLKGDKTGRKGHLSHNSGDAPLQKGELVLETTTEPDGFFIGGPLYDDADLRLRLQRPWSYMGPRYTAGTYSIDEESPLLKLFGSLREFEEASMAKERSNNQFASP
ncbi:hypothetical protein IFM89_022125 [Coptis chinensis]|uniref:Uncharacterized protein n=1 Tax=Coptis chinensis TaxID=261450 RepID=A0A835LJ53_9MAGN|nr:hypothetical protein IFM89_022125 [Coptis chinensis]